MKKKISLILISLIFAIVCAFNFTACSYTKSLVFRVIQENDTFSEWAGEVAIVSNTNRNIKKLKVPRTYKGKPVVLIRTNVFDHCILLTEVNLPDTIKYIGSYSFSYCEKLTTVKMPDSLLAIEEVAFEGDRELTSIAFSKNVFRIGKEAFIDCTKLKDVYFKGTQEDWEKINIGEGNECLLNAEIHFN